MDLRHILDEIEQASARCTKAGEAVQNALEALELGVVSGFLQTFMSDAPVRTSRRSSSILSSSDIVDRNDGLFATAEKAQAGLHIQPEATPGTTAPPVAAQNKSAPAKVADISGERNPGAADPFAELRKRLASRPLNFQFFPLQTPLDKLRDALNKAEHPLVKATFEANDVLDHVETTVLPTIDALTEEYQDKNVAALYVDMMELSKKRDEASRFIGNAIPELLKNKSTEEVSPIEAAKFLDIAFGRGRDSAVGIFVGCVVLVEMGSHLKKVASRLRVKIAIAGAKTSAASQESPSTAQSVAPETLDKPSAEKADEVAKQNIEQDVDFVILTAIDVELRAVRTAFGLTAQDRVKMGARVYWRGKVSLQSGEFYNIVVAQGSDMANTDAALTTSDMLHHWSPGAALLVGVAATTAPGKIKLGDIVVGSDVYYYERGKVTRKRTIPEPKSIPADLTLWNNMRSTEWDGKVDAPRPDNSDAKSTRHYGVIACGERVIADAATRDRIVAANRKIIAVEMEGYGFSLAILHNFERVRHLDIRGICDDGSENKDDRWHEYAATAAANLAKHFLLDRPLEPRTRKVGSSSSTHSAQQGDTTDTLTSPARS